ncbi:MAG: ECF transporter S component [Clostridia bacterium]|nr:ECF transporter S component [Clostridia bacterium]
MKTKRIVFTGIFAALVFITTWMIKFPISFGWGYMHFGDLAVMLSGMLLGPVYGAVAAAFGSALADYASGYAIYMLGTFVVKGLLAFGVGIAYKSLKGDKRSMNKTLRTIYHAVIASIVVVGGYFLVDLILGSFVIEDLGGDTALAYAAFGVIPNFIQVGFGIAASLVFYVPISGPFENIYDKEN